MLRAQLAAIRAHEAGVREGADHEELHQMRTAVRRLRAILRVVPAALASEPAASRRELRWLGRVLGTARDADVQREYFRTLLGSLAEAESSVVRRVLRRLEAHRSRARRRVLAVLDGRRYTRLVTDLQQALDEPRAVEAAGVARTAGDQFERLRKAVKALPADPSDAEVHAVRIVLRRARYAAELAEADGGRKVERFVRRAARLQDMLGEHQDAAVAERTLRAVRRALPSRAARAAAARLIERQRRRRRAAWRAFEDAWPALKRRGRKAWG
jgi:CHAD domain-containing protein